MPAILKRQKYYCYVNGHLEFWSAIFSTHLFHIYSNKRRESSHVKSIHTEMVTVTHLRQHATVIFQDMVINIIKI